MIFSGVYIVAAKRTAFGTFGGAFKNINQTQLQTAAAKAAIAASGVSADKIDTVVIGHIMTVRNKLHHICTMFEEFLLMFEHLHCYSKYFTKYFRFVFNF